jgi:diguanylate cyclase (GGDEF)-like protein
MEVPLYELTNYPRIHDASRAVLSLVEAAVGVKTLLLVQRVETAGVVLKAVGPAIEGLEDGDHLAERSALLDWLDSDQESNRAAPSIGGKTYDGAASRPVCLADGRTFGHVALLSREPLQHAHGELLSHAATVLGFVLDGEVRVGHDRLTGLYSRAMFDDHLRLELHRARRSGNRVAVIVIGFELPAGEHRMTDAWWLSRLGERLQSSVRQGDTIARIGAHEIALIVPDLRDEAAASRVLLTIQDSLEDPFATSSGPTSIRPFAGASLAPGDGLNPDVLMQRAIQAFEHAMEPGNATFLFYSDLRRITLLRR